MGIEIVSRVSGVFHEYNNAAGKVGESRETGKKKKATVHSTVEPRKPVDRKPQPSTGGTYWAFSWRYHQVL